MFEQILNPAGNLWLSIAIALVPLIALLFMLAAFRMTAWLASIVVGAITILLGALVWHAPVASTLKSYLYGRPDGILGDRLDHVLGPNHFQHPRPHRRLRTFQELDGSPRHRGHSNSNDHAGMGVWRTP